MIELQPEQFHGLHKQLRSVPINHLFARSVIERKVVGRTWADRRNDPSLVHVVHPCGMTLWFGNACAAHLSDLRAHMHTVRAGATDLWMQAHPETLWPLLDELLLPVSAVPDQQPRRPTIQRYTRTNFRFCLDRYAVKRSSMLLPEDCKLRPMTVREFALPDVAVSPHKFWRDPEQFLAHGGGWYVENDGRLASMAFSSFRFDSQLEIGVETRAEYRQRHYALHAACKLIDQCIEQGLEPVWSCRKENQGSYRLAIALGFEPTLEIPYYHLPDIAQ